VKNGVRCKPYKDWIAVLHRHHDHAKTSTTRRFNETVICDQCNVVDGAVKKKLKIYGYFSFSPSEIKQFIKATPHGRHRIDYVKAREIYERVNSR
jgi:hypothetical protein